ncbi:MAG: hypothetical protein ACYS5F_14625, partial [Planctomycetota bacterium]
YGTILTIKDQSALNEVWMDVSIRSYLSAQGERKIAIGKDIINGILGLQKTRDTWVVYEENLDNPDYYTINDKGEYERIVDGNLIYQEINFLIRTNLKQMWFNFYPEGKQLSYIDVADVDFILNVFNVHRAKEILNSRDQKFELLDGLGMWSYINYLFYKDEFYSTKKDSLKEYF